MKKEEIEKLISVNNKLSFILGHATALIDKYESRMLNKDVECYKWIIKSIENVIYLDKPLPPMP